MSTITLKLKQFLAARKISAYRLQKESGLAATTVYALAKNKGERLDLGTLAKILDALERLTGETLSPADLLERKQKGRPKKPRT